MNDTQKLKEMISDYESIIKKIKRKELPDSAMKGKLKEINKIAKRI